jgi:hypothetical protein
MKKLLLSFLLFASIAFGQTRNVSPRTDGAGYVGENYNG